MAQGDPGDKTPDQPGAESFKHRLIWFVGLWLGGVFALGVVGYAIRSWLGLS